MESRQNNFHLIRLFAACQVMLMHSVGHLDLTPTPALMPLYRVFMQLPGVAIFFVISGFLISGSYLNSGKGLAAYAESRALRIYPALWVNLAVLVLLLAIGEDLRFGVTSAQFWQWVGVAFPLGSDWSANRIAGYLFISGGHYPFFPSGVLWTIPVEMSFYLLVPIIFAPVFRPRLAVSLAGWGLLSLICFVTIDRYHYPIFIGLYLWIFLLGAAMQVYWRRIRWALEGKAWFWLPCYVLACFVVDHLTGHGFNYVVPTLPNFVLTAILACAVISCAFSARDLSSRLLGETDISYGIYLWHMPVIVTVLGWNLKGSWLIAFACYAVAVGLALTSWFWIERPALRQKGKLFRLRETA